MEKYRIIEDYSKNRFSDILKRIKPRQKEKGVIPKGWTILMGLAERTTAKGTTDELKQVKAALPRLNKAYSNVRWAIFRTWVVFAGETECTLTDSLCYKYEGKGSGDESINGGTFWHMMNGYVHGVLHTRASQ